MRRREKFIILSTLLSLALLAIQYIPLDWRYFGILALLFFLILVLSGLIRRFTSIRMGDYCSFSSSLRQCCSSFLLFITGGFVITLASDDIFLEWVCMPYLLTSNIFSVAKGRTIQLLYAAHAVSLFFVMITSLLLRNVIFSLRLPFYLNAGLIFAAHYPC
jgi:hypothetical protein